MIQIVILYLLFPYYCRPCYFTAESTNKKADFMKCLNSSYKLACLQCSFTDKELSEYIQFKKRGCLSLVKKYAVERIGRQKDDTWVFAHDVHLDSSGGIADSSFIWIGHVYNGLGVANDDQCTIIDLPLSIDPLCNLIRALKNHFKHNFVPCILTMGAAIMSLHYKLMLKKLKSCPVPLAFGESGTGKTTALLCALGMMGTCNTRLYSKVTIAKILQLCTSCGLPLGVDDPQSKNDISRLIIDLFNGAKNSTVRGGDQRPTSTCIIAANFTTVDQQR